MVRCSVSLLFLSTAMSAAAFSNMVGNGKKLSSTVMNGAVGGWGIGQSREITPEEYGKGELQHFEGFELREQGDFMRGVKDDMDIMKQAEMDELLGVARAAGIEVKDPSERLNKFSKDDLFLEDEDLDLRVYDDDDNNDSAQKRNWESITRMDEDTGAMGSW